MRIVMPIWGLKVGKAKPQGKFFGSKNMVQIDLSRNKQFKKMLKSKDIKLVKTGKAVININ